MAKIKENISSNTLFHFTSDYKYLEDILMNGFQPRYNLEKYYFLRSGLEIMFPMTCFCDIPLSKMKYHIGIYGNFGIGLSKDWGKNNRISPILYSYRGAKTAHFSIPLLNVPNQSYDLLYFLKPYDGHIFNQAKNRMIKYRFYDEREWRYVPNISKNSLFQKQLEKSEFGRKEECDLTLRTSGTSGLRFSVDDIRYLIVNENTDINNLIVFLQNNIVCGNPITVSQLNLLLTKIITVKQIIEDL